MTPDPLCIWYTIYTIYVIQYTIYKFFKGMSVEYWGMVFLQLLANMPGFCLLEKVERGLKEKNKLASLEATLVRNSAHLLNDLLTGVKCRATSVAKNMVFIIWSEFTLYDCPINEDVLGTLVPGCDEYSNIFRCEYSFVSYSYNFFDTNIFG